MLSWVSLDELMFLEFAHTPWCPTPFKAWDHRWHQDWEWASTDSMCTQELLTYCVVHQPKNLWFTCKPIDYRSHRLPRFSVNFACFLLSMAVIVRIELSVHVSFSLRCYLVIFTLNSSIWVIFRLNRNNILSILQNQKWQLSWYKGEIFNI